jgi:hypothetical protein
MPGLIDSSAASPESVICVAKDHERKPHPHRADSRMGEGGTGSVDRGSQDHRRKDLSTGCQSGKGVRRAILLLVKSR